MSGRGADGVSNETPEAPSARPEEGPVREHRKLRAFSRHLFGGLYFPANDSGIPRWIRGAETVDRCYAYVDKFGVALDIGAHVGLYALRLARRFEAVYAFEPDIHNFDCLVTNVVRLGNIHCCQAALGASSVEVRMVGKPSVSKRVEHFTTEQEAKVCLTAVQMRPLDWFGLEPDFVKIDVEGYERLVLVGGEKTFRKHRPVVILEDKGHWARYGSSSPLSLLENWGARQMEHLDPDVIYRWPNER